MERPKNRDPTGEPPSSSRQRRCPAFAGGKVSTSWTGYDARRPECPSGVLRDAIYQARWWPAPRQLSSDVYTRYRRVLAIQLADAAWSEVSLAYQELNEANWTSEPGEELANPLVRIDLQSVGISVVRARQALASAAAPPDHVSLLQDSAEGVANALFPVPHEGASRSRKS